MLISSNQTTERLPHTNSIRAMLHQLDLKIGEISHLKDEITLRIHTEEDQEQRHPTKSINETAKSNQQRQNIIKFINSRLIPSIENELARYNKDNRDSIMQLIGYYERQLDHCRAYYQNQIDEQREEIRRQYKVIGLMKQEVQDLMVLIKEQRLDENQQWSSERSEQPQRSNEDLTQETQEREQRNRFALDLDIIQQETERTLLSSERSHRQVYDNSHLNLHLQFSEHHLRDDERANNSSNSNRQIRTTEHQLTPSRSQSKPKAIDNNFIRIDNESECQSNSEHFISNNPTVHNNCSMQDFHEQDLSPNVLLAAPAREHNNVSQFEESEGYSCERESKPDFIRKQAKNIGQDSHLQSIFFPDEQPQSLTQYSKLRHYGEKINSRIEHPHEVSQSKSLSHSKISYSGEDEYSLTEGCYGPVTTSSSAFFNSHIPQARDESFQTNTADCQKIKAKEFVKSSSMMLQVIDEKKEAYSSTKSHQFIKNPQPHLVDVTNLDNNSHRSPKLEPQGQGSTGKPKTKQFLQQFRKTFNKCLNSMQVAKKNSTKQNNATTNTSKSQNMSPSNVTFGRVPTPDSRSFRELPAQDKIGSHLKAVEMMFKQLDHNNKFLIGCKKIQLKYEGERKNAVRHGNGVLFYSNGLCYEGEFKDGLRHGYGILKFNHIQIYNGDWQNDQIEGQGKIRNCAIINKKKSVCSSQSALGKWISYSGQFKNSRFEGSGTLYLQGGEKFVGNFSAGVATGQGAIYRKTGQVHQGIWKNNILQSKGSSHPESPLELES